MVQTLQKLITRLRQFVFWLAQQEGTPGRRARGLAIGIFAGCFPLFGLQTVLGLSLATLFRANRLLAATATWISNPFTYLPIYWFNYRMGCILIGPGENKHYLNQMELGDMWNQGWIVVSRLLIGSSFVGILSGLLTGLIAYLVLKSKPQVKN